MFGREAPLASVRQDTQIIRAFNAESTDQNCKHELNNIVMTREKGDSVDFTPSLHSLPLTSHLPQPRQGRGGVFLPKEKLLNLKRSNISRYIVLRYLEYIPFKNFNFYSDFHPISVWVQPCFGNQLTSPSKCLLINSRFSFPFKRL